jgi:hypothetical protein
MRAGEDEQDSLMYSSRQAVQGYARSCLRDALPQFFAYGGRFETKLTSHVICYWCSSENMVTMVFRIRLFLLGKRLRAVYAPVKATSIGCCSVN